MKHKRKRERYKKRRESLPPRDTASFRMRRVQTSPPLDETHAAVPSFVISRDILQADRFHVAHVYADIHAHISGRHTAHHGETRAKTRVGMQKCDSPVRPTTAGLFARVLVTSDKGQPLKKNAVSLTSSSAHSGVRQTNCTRGYISIVSLKNLPLSVCRVTTRF